MIIAEKGKEIEIAKIKEPGAICDPTYDGLDLIADISWLLECGEELASFLNLKLIIDKELQWYSGDR